MTLAYQMALKHLGIKNGVNHSVNGLGSHETELLRIALKHSGLGAAADFVEGEAYTCGTSGTGAFQCVGTTSVVKATFKALQTQVNRVVGALVARGMNVQSWKLIVDGAIGTKMTSTVAKLLASPLIQQAVPPPHLPPLMGSTIGPPDVAASAATLADYFKQVADTLGASLPLTPAGAPRQTPSPSSIHTPQISPPQVSTGPTSLPAVDAGPDKNALIDMFAKQILSSRAAGMTDFAIRSAIKQTSFYAEGNLLEADIDEAFRRAGVLVPANGGVPVKASHKTAWIVAGILGTLVVGTTVVLVVRARARARGGVRT